MNLVVFDIDGTLLDSSRVDDACFVRAVKEAFGFEDICEDWSAYEHCTDVAIAAQLIREWLGRACTQEDLERLRSRFVSLLRDAHAIDAAAFRMIAGADAMFASFAGDGIGCSLATGGFQASARLKLELAGLACDGLPAAFSEDGPSREQIVMSAIQRSTVHYNVSRFERIVSVGDGVWDVRTAAALNVPFVGIAADDRADRLRAAGAKTVLPDFADLDRVMSALERAALPESKVA